MLTITNRKSVLVVDNRSLSYYQPFSHIGLPEINPNILKTPEKVSLVVFTGGEDVSPSLYGEDINPKTYCNPSRDSREKAVFDRALELKIPIAGICRGSQLICALSGGKLAQHINNHGHEHNIMTDDNETITVSSTHHQMQLPSKTAQVVAWASPKLSDYYEGPAGVRYDPEYEYDVVYYPNTNALAMQYHPEFMTKESRGFKYCAELVKRFFGLG